MKKGTPVKIKIGILAGMRAEVKGRSRSTGTLTLILKDTRGAWKPGATVHMEPYEVAEITEKPPTYN